MTCRRRFWRRFFLTVYSDDMKETITNPLIKDQVTFIKTTRETAGRVTEIEVVLSPGGGTPLHFHKDFTEQFIVLEGQLGIQLGKKQVQTLGPGMAYTVQKREVHRFFNATSEKVKFKTIIEPGSVGFENSLRILYGLAGDNLTNNKGIPRDLISMAVISNMSGMYLPGAFKLLTPLFNILAGIGCRKGVDKQLLGKYCV
jgi:quercetin dioxygenase-like cupin family protein